MTTKFIVVCAAVLLVQENCYHGKSQFEAVAGSKLVYGLGGGSAAAASAASAAAARNAAAASAAAASAAAARGGGAGSAAASSAASAAATRNAAAASAAAASAAALRGGAASSAASSAARAASAGSAGGALLGLADYDIIYSEPLLVTSTSGIYPTGLSVSSDIGLEGPMYVYGRLPFLSAVGFEDSLSTDGSGVATCGCGSDNIGIIQEV